MQITKLTDDKFEVIMSKLEVNQYLSYNGHSPARTKQAPPAEFIADTGSLIERFPTYEEALEFFNDNIAEGIEDLGLEGAQFAHISRVLLKVDLKPVQMF